MSPDRAWRHRIQDILDAIAEVQEFLQGMDFDAFQSDVKTLKAVELNFIIIGEASTHVPQDVQETHNTVPWHLMRAMRNRLVHVYFNVDPQILWETTQNDLPPLALALARLLDTEKQSGKME